MKFLVLQILNEGAQYIVPLLEWMPRVMPYGNPQNK